MPISIEQAFNDLFTWCRVRDFAGHDPFDALNSRVFQLTPIKHSRNARLIWTQAFKRSPINVRSLALVPGEKNAKGLALFALAALANYRRLKTTEAEAEARELLDELSQARSSNSSAAAWGYNFPWQSRKFFTPANWPMVVPTAFAARAFIEAYRSLGDDNYLEQSQSTCEFILTALKRPVNTGDEVCFSYSSSDQTRIFNASLLAAETLASVGRIKSRPEFCELAQKASNYVVRRQRDDGSWAYGAEAGQEWTDSFHTAFVLTSFNRIAHECGQRNEQLSLALRRGYAFWKERFFLADGWPKYYHDSLYPADAHAAATAITTLLDLRELDSEALSLAETIAGWTINNLRDARGFFYYQRRRFYTVRTAYMRWTQAWMLYALGRLLEEQMRKTNAD